MSSVAPHPLEPEAQTMTATCADAGLDILFLTHYFPPEGNAPASRVYEMAKRWVRRGHRVRIITCAPNCPGGVVYDGYRNRFWQRETIDGIEVLRVWSFIAANRGTLRRTLNYLSFMASATIAATLSRRPDVLVATSPQFFCGVAGMLSGWIKRVPFVLEIRDIWPESIRAVGAVRTAVLLKPIELLASLMYRSARLIVTVGDGYKEQLTEQGIAAERISVVTNGVDTELFTATVSDKTLRDRYDLGDRFVCAYVGTIGMASGLEVVLRAGRLLRERGRDDIAFLIVGDGAIREALENQAKRDGLTNVVFTGRLDKARIPGLIASVDACLVHLQRKRLFRYVLPSKIFEAAAMGKPILLGVEGFAADLIQRSGGGLLVEPENALHLVEQVEHLADNPDHARQLGQAGRAYVLEHFNRDDLSDQYLALLNALCA